MTQEEVLELKGAIDTTTTEDDAAILIVKRDDEVRVKILGAPRAERQLKNWAYKWLGGREAAKI